MRLFDTILSLARFPQGKMGGWRGCLLGNTALEMGAHDPTVRDQLGRGVRTLQTHFGQALRLPNGSRGLLSEPTIEGRALQSVAAIQGLLVLAKSGAREKEIQNAKAFFIASLVSS
jgi:hypothetical protein